MSINSISLLSNFSPIIVNDPIERFCSAKTIEALDLVGEFGDNYTRTPTGESGYLYHASVFFNSDEFLNNTELSEAVLEKFAQGGQLPRFLKTAVYENCSTDTLLVILKSNAFKNMPMVSNKEDQQQLVSFLEMLAWEYCHDKGLLVLELALKEPCFDFLAFNDFVNIWSKAGYEYHESEGSIRNAVLFIDKLINHPNFQRLSYNEIGKMCHFLILTMGYEYQIKKIEYLLAHCSLSKEDLFSILNEVNLAIFMPGFGVDDEKGYEEPECRKIYAPVGHNIIFGAYNPYCLDDLLSKEKLLELQKEYNDSSEAIEILHKFGSIIDAHYDYYMTSSTHFGDKIKSLGISKDDFRAFIVHLKIDGYASTCETFDGFEKIVSKRPY